MSERFFAAYQPFSAEIRNKEDLLHKQKYPTDDTLRNMPVTENFTSLNSLSGEFNAHAQHDQLTATFVVDNNVALSQ